MTTPIKFGTDGWRAVIAQDFTFDNVRICAQAVADYLKQSGLASRGLVVGYDTRFTSEDFAAVTAEVVAANGIKVYLCPKPTPTPVISYATLAKKAGGGVVITASHNPPQWNGFKYKSETGSSAPPDVIAELEKYVARIVAGEKVQSKPLAESLNQKLVEYLDLEPIYFEQMARLVDLDKLRQAKLKIVVDSMYGAGSGYIKKLLAGGNIEITEIHADRNPLFPDMHQPEPIASNLGRLMTTVKRRKASAGLATDGDADRMGIVDENGTFLTQLQVYALLCLYLLEVRGERGPIIKTITTSSMLYRLGELFHVPVYETSVGFKYVAPEMVSRNAIIGGEESGGYGFRGHVIERDGIIANLYFLDLMVKTGKTPSQLIKYLYDKVGPHYYNRLDLDFPEEQRQTIIVRLKNHGLKQIDSVEIVRFETSDGFRFILADTTWLLIRFSGTEPLMRIYAESNSPERVERLLQFGKTLTGV